jgi:long-chain acyl-CoA synthetase
LRLLAFGASPMPVDRLQAAMAVFPDTVFMQMYGMTETAPFATALRYDATVVNGPPEVSRRLASCGRAIPGVEARVVRDDGREAKPGDAGEIVMRGPNIMVGYWRQPEATAEALRDGWMHSGDVATVDDEGYIFIVDRKKDMIITGGENVYSTEVENALYRHPAVLEAAVIGIPDAHWGERVHAVVVLKEGEALEPSTLSDFCRQHIAGYKIPRSVELVEALPKTGSGKIQKSVIRERYWQAHEATTGRRV